MRNRTMTFRPILFKVSQEIIVYMEPCVEVSSKPQAQQVRKCGPVETISSISTITTNINHRISELLMIILVEMNSTKGQWRKKKKGWRLHLAANSSLHNQKQNNLVKTRNTKISNNYFSVP
jgi:hypothetical protein